MGGMPKAIVAALVLAISGSTAYYLFVQKQKVEQRENVVALLGDSTTHLRRALNGTPSVELAHELAGNLKLVKAPRHPDLETAAGLYIQSAREIARRRSDSERLSREAAMSRRALTMHMSAASQRDTYWIRVASDLKKRVERDHSDLAVSLKALTLLLTPLPESQKELAPHVDAKLLLEDAVRRQARDRAEEQAKRAADELEKVRRLGTR